MSQYPLLEREALTERATLDLRDYLERQLPAWDGEWRFELKERLFDKVVGDRGGDDGDYYGAGELDHRRIGFQSVSYGVQRELLVEIKRVRDASQESTDSPLSPTPQSGRTEGDYLHYQDCKKQRLNREAEDISIPIDEMPTGVDR